MGEVATQLLISREVICREHVLLICIEQGGIHLLLSKSIARKHALLIALPLFQVQQL